MAALPANVSRIKSLLRRVNILEQRLEKLMTEGTFFRANEPDEVRLYLEAHVTIEPVFDERRELAADIAKRFNFKLADLLMKKRAEDTEERSAKDTFMTGHSKSKADIATRTMGLVRTLQASGFKVWRYKVEDTLLDSRNADEWNLIDAADRAD